MLLTASKAYVIAFFAAYLLMGVLNPSGKFDFGRRRLGFYALMASLVVLSYHFEPSVSDDLYRHFATVRRAMAGGVWWGSEESSSLLLWGLMVRASAALRDVHFLPAIAVFITMAFWIQTLKYVSKQSCISNFSMVLYLLICTALCSWIQLFSDLRNICAFSIVSFVVARVVYEDRLTGPSIGLNFALLFGATAIHPSAWIAIALLLISNINVKMTILLVLVAAWSLLAPVAIDFLGNLPIGSLGLLASKASAYILDENLMDSRIIFSEWLTVGILLGWYVLWGRNLEEDGQMRVSSKYRSWFIAVSLFVLSSLQVYVLVYRFSMLLAMTSLPALLRLTRKHSGLLTDILCAIVVIACVGMCAYNYVHLFSHMTLPT